jgi:uncharacterized protein (DUF952 family)
MDKRKNGLTKLWRCVNNNTSLSPPLIMKKFIYKICSKFEWSNFQKKNFFYGTKQDIIDGYIHFSDKKQIKSTLKKHFFRKDKLILLKIDTSKLKNILWEKSAGNKIFPHLYSRLTLSSVKKTYKISLKKNGIHFFSSKY